MVRLLQIMRDYKVKVSCLCAGHEGISGNGDIAPLYLQLETIWTKMVRFALRPLYPRGKSLRNCLSNRLSGPQQRCRCF